jgi:hypothetical protein
VVDGYDFMPRMADWILDWSLQPWHGVAVGHDIEPGELLREAIEQRMPSQPSGVAIVVSIGGYEEGRTKGIRGAFVVFLGPFEMILPHGWNVWLAT